MVAQYVIQQEIDTLRARQAELSGKVWELEPRLVMRSRKDWNAGEEETKTTGNTEWQRQ
jgi:hypothetical protein